jgi:hypothetical protein
MRSAFQGQVIRRRKNVDVMDVVRRVRDIDARGGIEVAFIERGVGLHSRAKVEHSARSTSSEIGIQELLKLESSPSWMQIVWPLLNTVTKEIGIARARNDYDPREEARSGGG